MKLSAFKNARERREFLEKKLGVKFSLIKKAHLHNEKKICCENLIGETTLPLGVAGPLKIKNLKSKIKNYYLPLATTEGVLVASVNRGCKAINLSGGAKVFIEKTGTTRGPVYETGGIERGFWFLKWLKKNEGKIKKQAESTSSHLKYLKHQGKVIGPYTFVRFYFDTDQAMGMNMSTVAVEAINQLIEKETKIRCLSLSGNFCVDKKPSWLNFIDGRGYQAWAETVINQKVLKKILKTTAEKFFDTWLSKCLIGGAVSGSLGFNSHFTNMVAAFFSATGQDLAHIVEGSLGITTTKVLTNSNLYFSVYLPSLMMGMVGGGTKLAIKKEAIALTGAKNTEELATVLAGAVLAGELSLLASLSEGSLAEAHKKLGR
ncbi:MAG: hydroxymethylglutaryl-CoA reductase [Patescibacteria group bacterium]|nr:hydroxymethylglutaryl-CoA reductase [Patescibacteria group bacterium]